MSNSLFYMKLIPVYLTLHFQLYKVYHLQYDDCERADGKWLVSICLEGVRKTKQKLSEKLGPKLRFKFIDFLNRSAKRLVVLHCFSVTPHGNCSYTESAISKASKTKMTLMLSLQLTGCMSYKGITYSRPV
jgi:hypothetical protein